MANTLAGVNVAQIAERSLDYMKAAFAPVKALHRDFSEDIQSKGASVTTRIVSGVTAQDLSAGYTPQNVTLTGVTVTLNQFDGFVLQLTDEEVSKAGSAEWLAQNFVEPAIEAILAAFFANTWALVTEENFAAEVVKTSSQLDADAAADLGVTLSTAKVPRRERSLILPATYYGNLVKDTIVESLASSGSSEALREGTIRRIRGFDVHEYTGTIPENSEDLAGMALHPSALAFAARPVATPKDFPGQVENGMDSDSGLPLQFRGWYDANAGAYKISMGVLYGVAKGVGSALIRIRHTAAA